jgi:hypothetical protein
MVGYGLGTVRRELCWGDENVLYITKPTMVLKPSFLLNVQNELFTLV